MISVDGEPRLGIQLAPNHVQPDWPDGTPQQVHLDLYVDDVKAAHEEATSLVPDCSSQQTTSNRVTVSRSTPTRPAIRSASAGSAAHDACVGLRMLHARSICRISAGYTTQSRSGLISAMYAVPN